MANTYITVAAPADEMKEEFAQLYRDHSLDSLAKETGIVDTNLIDLNMATTSVATTPQYIQPKQTFTQPKQQAMRYITLPCPITQQVVTPISTPMNTIQNASLSNQVFTAIESPNWNSIKKRPLDSDYPESVKRRRMDKTGKGLRHFSMKVCEKVKRKRVTSYNEVADELVADLGDPYNLTQNNDQYDQKNIRRRVYDALNVLMAMNIISKEKKEIRWKGLPTNSIEECRKLEKERETQVERVKHKTQQLQELILQQIAFKNLVQRNKENEQNGIIPSEISTIQLPFIIVNTSKKTVIDCSIANDKAEYLFNFNNTFEIHDDIEVLKRMGLAFGLEKNQCSDADLEKAVNMMPKGLETYIRQLAGKNTVPLTVTPQSMSKGYPIHTATNPATPSSACVDHMYAPLLQSPLARPLPSTSHTNAGEILPKIVRTSSLQRDSPITEELYSCVDSDSESSSPLIIT